MAGTQRPAGLSSRTMTLLLTSSRTARRADPGSRWAPRKILWIPASAGMTAKRMRRSLPLERHRGRYATPSRPVLPYGDPSFDVIPDGPQGRAGIQCSSDRLVGMRAVCARDLPRPRLGSRFGLPRAFPLRRPSGPSSCIARPAQQPPRRIAGRVACRPRPLKPPNDTAATGAWCRASL